MNERTLTTKGIKLMAQVTREEIQRELDRTPANIRNHYNALNKVAGEDIRTERAINDLHRNLAVDERVLGTLQNGIHQVGIYYMGYLVSTYHG